MKRLARRGGGGGGGLKMLRKERRRVEEDAVCSSYTKNESSQPLLFSRTRTRELDRTANSQNAKEPNLQSQPPLRSRSHSRSSILLTPNRNPIRILPSCSSQRIQHSTSLSQMPIKLEPQLHQLLQPLPSTASSSSSQKKSDLVKKIEKGGPGLVERGC